MAQLNLHKEFGLTEALGSFENVLSRDKLLNRKIDLNLSVLTKHQVKQLKEASF